MEGERAVVFVDDIGDRYVVEASDRSKRSVSVDTGLQRERIVRAAPGRPQRKKQQQEPIYEEDPMDEIEASDTDEIDERVAKGGNTNKKGRGGDADEFDECDLIMGKKTKRTEKHARMRGRAGGHS